MKICSTCAHHLLCHQYCHPHWGPEHTRVPEALQIQDTFPYHWYILYRLKAALSVRHSRWHPPPLCHVDWRQSGCHLAPHRSPMIRLYVQRIHPKNLCRQWPFLWERDPDWPVYFLSSPAPFRRLVDMLLVSLVRQCCKSHIHNMVTGRNVAMKAILYQQYITNELLKCCQSNVPCVRIVNSAVEYRNLNSAATDPAKSGRQRRPPTHVLRCGCIVQGWVLLGQYFQHSWYSTQGMIHLGNVIVGRNPHFYEYRTVPGRKREEKKKSVLNCLPVCHPNTNHTIVLLY